MKRTAHLILLAIFMLTPAAMRAQESESLYNGWGIGFHMGMGGIAPTGSLSDDFKGCALFISGLDAEYNRLRLKANIAYGQPSLKNENPYAVYDELGRNLQLNGTANTTLLGLGLQLGYTVWRQGSVSVTPMVGMNWNRLSWDLNDINYEKGDEGEVRPMIDNVTDTKESSLGWMASIDIDVKLHSTLVNNPMGHYTSSLRISPFVASAKYSDLNPSVKGVCIGATVTYAGFLRLMGGN